MLLRWFGFSLSVMGTVFAVVAAPEPKPTPEAAIRKSYPLLQHSAKLWFQRTKCDSCHHQSITQVAVALAQERGVKVDKAKSIEQNLRIIEQGESARFKQYESTGAINGSSGFSYMLLGFAAAQVPQSDSTDATVYYLLGKQAVDGRWPSFSRRPPLEDSPFTTTAMAIRGISLYSPEYLQKDAALAISKGYRWLTKTRAKTTEESVYQILGIIWSGRDRSLIPQLKSRLIAQQRSDGGWAQLPTGDSDAYATGQVLVTLHIAGVSSKDKIYQQGVDFLLRNQLKDGSWLVETRRRFPGLPYFETGFPHGKHQFISFVGTAWASMALAIENRPGTTHAFTSRQVAPRTKPYAPLSSNRKDERLFAAVQRGSVGEMLAAIRAGAKVDGLSKGGATPLMYAIRDPKKVQLLLTHGANPNFVSVTKTTPLMLAAEYVGTDESLKLLLKAGANPDKARDEFESVLSLASGTGDVSRVKLLLRHKLDEKTILMGAATACWGNDIEMLKVFLDAGIDTEGKVMNSGETLLTFTSSDGFLETTRLLLDRGANPNNIAKNGISTLMLAAMCDFGSTEIVKLLLKHGADPNYKSVEGKTALSLAQKYKNDEIAEAISSFGK